MPRVERARLGFRAKRETFPNTKKKVELLHKTTELDALEDTYTHI